MMTKQDIFDIILFIILLIVSTLLVFEKTPTHTISIAPQRVTMNFHLYAQNLTINGTVDPPCNRTQDIYICSGYCPWSNTHNDKLIACSFLPRILHPDFVKLRIYCTPEPDSCPTYDAWLKDTLPPTLEHIKRIPYSLYANFTLDFSIPVRYGLQNFLTDDILPRNWTNEEIEKYHKYASIAVINKSCAVIGAEYPWIEAALLEYNASMVTTIEHATIFSNVTRLKTITPRAFAQKQQSGTRSREFFDSVWSYSSLEHDGLGQYRDPLNPYGDLQTMTKIACILRPGGFLFLGVPLNIKDHLQYNLYRLYGPIRLPLLYRYFHIVEVLGATVGKDIYSNEIQPFVVLQNKVGCKRS
ncbi:unnamed protein product [Adineta ricciae]|uniref:Uncharacterized protein n=1 Tax=Adineta ricciae TaxID=249248 RepID=A0A813UY19_ADIRI|nr:unnamed protein product [Adineta ricciae]